MPPGRARRSEVTGEQFQWEIRYPGPDGKFDTPDDIVTLNQLHFPVGPRGGRDAQLEGRDPLVLPARVPRQAGRRARADDPDLVRRRPRSGNWELACAELCGLGPLQDEGLRHRRTRPRSSEWLAEQARAEQNRSGSAPRPPAPRGDDPTAPGADRRARRRDEGGVLSTVAVPLETMPTARRRPRGADVLLAQVHLLDRSQDHRHPVPVLGADLLRARRPAGDGGPLAARLARAADADPRQARSGAGMPGGRMPPEFYNMLFTMHATIMIFFVIIPLLTGAFGNFLIPLHDRRARHGVPEAEHALVLVHVAGVRPDHLLSFFVRGRRGRGGLDELPDALAARRRSTPGVAQRPDAAG